MVTLDQKLETDKYVDVESGKVIWNAIKRDYGMDFPKKELIEYFVELGILSKEHRGNYFITGTADGKTFFMNPGDFPPYFFTEKEHAENHIDAVLCRHSDIKRKDMTIQRVPRQLKKFSLSEYNNQECMRN